MCFSSTASFVAGSVLAVTSAASLRVIQRKEQRPLALIPLLFSMQQFCEGFLWLSFKQPELSAWELPFIYSFLFFAQVIWPVWVPYTFYKEEESNTHKKRLKVLLFLGGILSLYLLYCLLRFPVHAKIASGHIQYMLSFPEYPVHYTRFIYFLAIVLPPFVSSKKSRKIIGSFLFVSFTVSFIFFSDFLISIWCYFAALISLTIYFVLQDEMKEVAYNKKTLQ